MPSQKSKKTKFILFTNYQEHYVAVSFPFGINKANSKILSISKNIL